MAGPYSMPPRTGLATAGIAPLAPMPARNSMIACSLDSAALFISASGEMTFFDASDADI